MFDRFRTPGWDIADKNDPNKYDNPSSGILEDWYRSGSLMANLFMLFGIPAVGVWFLTMAFIATGSFGEALFLLWEMANYWPTWIGIGIMLWVATVVYSVAKRKA